MRDVMDDAAYQMDRGWRGWRGEAWEVQLLSMSSFKPVPSSAGIAMMQKPCAKASVPAVEIGKTPIVPSIDSLPTWYP